jgi:hypothetical protein
VEGCVGGEICVMRVETIGDCTLYLADCMDVLHMFVAAPASMKQDTFI